MMRGGEALLLDEAHGLREVALHNVQSICPSLATVLTNAHQEPSELFIAGSVQLSR